MALLTLEHSAAMATLNIPDCCAEAAHFLVPNPTCTTLLDGAVPARGGAAVGGLGGGVNTSGPNTSDMQYANIGTVGDNSLNQLTGQNVKHSENQYRNDRDPKEPGSYLPGRV